MRKTIFTVRDVLAGLLCTLFFICTAVVGTLNFRPLYYGDINRLDIPAYSGMDEAEIRQNYDALIAYNSLLFNGPLEFPTLPMSRAGEIHFAEVKTIFVAVQWGMLLSLPASTVLAVFLLRRRRHGFLKWAGIFSLALPAGLGLLAAIGWNSFFVRFHELFFHNDYWIFDARTDPVILLLPDGFFFHCAMMIFGLVLLAAALCLLAYAWLRKKSKKYA